MPSISRFVCVTQLNPKIPEEPSAAALPISPPPELLTISLFRIFLNFRIQVAPSRWASDDTDTVLQSTAGTTAVVEAAASHGSETALAKKE